jgi:predicted ATPase/class 3 adenylate cyclase
MRTLLFSDIEGSTDLLRRAGDDYAGLLLHHREIMRAAVNRAGGTEHGTEGDSFFVSFDSASSAISAAVQAQRELETFDWPADLRIRVRIGIHLGEVAHHDGTLVGLAVHHAARIAGSAHGGQIVVSDAVRVMARVLPADTSLEKLGDRRLRDVGIVTLFQVEHPELQRVFPELRGVIGNRTNLPHSATGFIGGEHLLTSIEALIDGARVVTLTGTGGVGKTRAAVEFGWRFLERFDDGVFFVDLAPIADAGAVSAAVAATMPMVSSGGLSLLEGIVDWVADRRLLLVIDNCEHVLGEVCQLVSAVVAGCEHAKVLATSREALGVAGERAYRVPSLDVAEDAVEMFCERAAASDSLFERSGHEAVLVEICKRVDGIPLAIELAAARMSSMSPEELLVRLQDRFRLLRGSGRGSLERHQTLRATVLWSYQLLTDDERLIFDSLSVFAGGFDMRAAGVVCATEGLDELDLLDVVHSLVDKSMVVAERTPAGTRFRLLETLRQFGEEQLEVRAATPGLRDRHAAYFATLAGELDLLVRSARQVEASANLSTDWDNIRAAHLWALACEDLALAAGLVHDTFYHARSQMRHEHSEWAQRTVELADSVGRPSTDILATHSEWLNIQGDEAKALRIAERGIEVAPSPDHPTTAACWWMLCGASPLTSASSAAVRDAFEHMQVAVANVADHDIDWWPMCCLVDAALAVDPVTWEVHLRRLSDIADRVRAPQLITYTCHAQGHAMLLRSVPDHVAATACYERALVVSRSADDVGAAASSLRALALVATDSGRADALACCRDALDALYEIRYWQKLWQVLDSVVLNLARAGRNEQAALILGHLQAHMPACGMEETLGFRVAAAESTAAAGDYTSALAHGAQLDADEIVAAALDYCTSTPSH